MVSLEKIDALLKEKGWNRSDLARRANMTVDHISHIFNDQKDIKLSTLDKIIKALGCTYEDICDES